MSGDGAAVEAIRSGLLRPVPHAFLGRRGGVSGGAWAGLNMGSGAGDDPGAVAENRRRGIAAVMPGARLVTVRQVHSADAVVVGDPWDDDRRPLADALATDRPGLLLGIVTADCAPVLLADVRAGVVGAAHAGWRGARDGVLEAAVGAMVTLGAEPARIAAAIGPCIARASYEVDDGFRDGFGVDLSGRETLFEPAARPGHWMFDLAGHVAMRLAHAGVGTIDRLGLDTYADAARFYSHRRAVHRGEPDGGRQMAMIGMTTG